MSIELVQLHPFDVQCNVEELLHKQIFEILELIANSDLDKGKDLSESGKEKLLTPFFLKIRILNREWQSHLPMKEKTLSSRWSRANLSGTFADSRVHRHLGQPLVVKNLNFE